MRSERGVARQGSLPFHGASHSPPSKKTNERAACSSRHPLESIADRDGRLADACGDDFAPLAAALLCSKPEETPWCDGQQHLCRTTTGSRSISPAALLPCSNDGRGATSVDVGTVVLSPATRAVLAEV